MNRLVPIVGLVLASLVLVKAVRPVIAEALDPQQATVSGVVYEDRNGNDKRDAGERGVRGVSVTDGVSTVETDSAGQYRLEVDVARRITDLVFITKPAGYDVPTDQYKTPRFYRDLGQLADGAGAGADFALLPDPSGRSDDFTFANVADPHRNANMASQMRQITETSKELAFVQVSGDLTDNATDAEFMQYKTGTTASKLPVWPAVGNHEYFNAGPSTYEARIDNYRRHVGPEWYSFDHGRRHFLVLENNGAAPIEEQREWMEADLEDHARGKRVVVLMHMPMNVPFGSPVGLRRLRRGARAVRHGAGAGRPRALQRRRRLDLGQGRPSHPDELELVHDRPQPARLPLRDDEGPALQQPVPDVRRRALARRHQPGARRGADRPRRGAGQRLPHVRARQGRVLPARRPRPLAQPKPSGDFTWYGDIDERPTARTRSRSWPSTRAARAGARPRRSRSAAAGAPRIEPGADWAQFHGDQQHSGVAADLLEPDLQLAWTHRTRGVFLTGSPVIADGVAYAGVRDENGTERGGVHAVELDSGRKLWEFDVPSSVHGTPAVSGGTVLIPSLRGTLYAVSARTGRLRWKREPEPGTPPVNQRSYSYYSPAVADGTVYWPHQTRYGKASRGLLSALDARTGAVKWESPMTGATMSDGTPAVADGRVYVGNETADRVIAYDAATGAQLWTATARLGGWQDASPTAVGGRVFIGSNNRVIARDAATGADLWQHQSPDASWIPQNATPSAPAVAGNTLNMGFPNGRVTALDVASGAVVWSVRLPGQPYLGGVLSPPAVSGDTVYVGANNGHLYGLDRATGAEKWKFEIGSWVASGPAISANALLAGAWDGNLYAFAGKG